MRIAETLLPEVDQEAKTTRRVLERVPQEHADWKPHPKSSSLSALAMHVANLPLWMSLSLTGTEFDLAALQPAREFAGTAALLEEFDRKMADARAALASASDEELGVLWTLRKGDYKVFTMPRTNVLRFFVMNHLIHHRGQLTVYLRLLDVPLPSVYGPTADER